MSISKVLILRCRVTLNASAFIVCLYCVQHHTNIHTVQCVRGEFGPAQGVLEHSPTPQQQQRAGGAHAAADRVPGTAHSLFSIIILA